MVVVLVVCSSGIRMNMSKADLYHQDAWSEDVKKQMAGQLDREGGWRGLFKVQIMVPRGGTGPVNRWREGGDKRGWQCLRDASHHGNI